MDLAIAVPVGLAVGAVLGLLGAGGSLLTVPALIFLLGMTVTEATGTSLVAVAMMAVAGLIVHQRAGRCECREGLGLGAVAAPTAGVAGWLASGLSDRLLGGAFVVLLVGTAIWLIRREEPSEDDRPAEVSTARSAAAGAGVGVLAGLLGVGGGFMIVPALVGLRGLRMPVAVGTSQLVVLISAIAGIAGRLTGDSLQWRIGALFGLGGLVGATIGSKLADRAPADGLRLGFAAVAILVAGMMGWQVVVGGRMTG